MIPACEPSARCDASTSAVALKCNSVWRLATKVGNKVRFTADAVPNVEYTGVVERISDATGSAFSLVPIDNATGNFVKVEQRVTVRVRLDACDELKKLHGGYNVVCKVEE